MNLMRRRWFVLMLLCGTLGSLEARGQTDGAALEKWRKILRRPVPAEQQLAAQDDLAKRQAAAAIALLRLGDAESVWPLLRHEADPSRRSYLIRDIGRFGIKADVVVGRLQSEADVSARRALILILGAFDGDILPAIVRTPLASKLLDLYRNDPDPGVHSAIDWLLRYGRQGLADRRLDWNEADGLRLIDSQLAGQPPAGRKWFVTKESHTSRPV
jgi:HEAT repeat protein